MRIYNWLFLVIIAGTLLAGCSDGIDENPVTLPESGAHQFNNTVGTACVGLWQVTIDPATGSIQATQLRRPDLILNVLSFLEPPAMTNLTIDFGTLSIQPAQKLVSVDVILTHPLVTPKGRFHGFDLRGIVMGPEILNADGFTQVMNPADFEGVPFGYIDGLIGTPHSVAGYNGVWGYKYFADDLGLNDDLPGYFSDPGNLASRGIFREGSQNSRHYELSWADCMPPIDFFVFNYAVYANYDAPTPPGPFDVDDFPITTANSAEAFCASATDMENYLWFTGGEGGGTLSLDIEIFDWQGFDGTDVEIFSGTAIPPTLPDSYSAGPTDKSRIYHFVNIEPMLATSADLDIYIRVFDAETFGSAWFHNLLPGTHPLYAQKLYTMFRHTSPVSDEVNNILFYWTGESGSGDPMIVPPDFNNTWTYLSGTDMCWDENGDTNKMATLCTGTTWVHTPDIAIPSAGSGDFDIMLRVKHWGGANPPWLYEPDPTGFDSGGFIAYRIPPSEDWLINSDLYPWLTYSEGNNFNSVNMMNLAIGGASAWCPYLGINYGPDVWDQRAFGAKLFQNLWGSKAFPWDSTFKVDDTLKGETIQFGFYWGGLEEDMGKADYPGWCIREIEVFKVPQ